MEQIVDSIISKYAIVPLARMSLEEINKYLPIPNDSRATGGIIRKTIRKSPRWKPLKSILKKNIVKQVDTVACNLDKSLTKTKTVTWDLGDESFTKTRWKPLKSPVKQVNTPPIALKRKSIISLRSEERKRRLDRSSHRDDSLPKRLPLDTSLVESNKETTERFEHGNEMNKELESLKLIANTAHKMYQDMLALTNKYANLDRVMTSN